MCGISCVVDGSGRADLAPILEDLHRPIRHRGPDGEGFTYVCADGQTAGPSSSPAVGLSFRRLKILDTSAAASQPMRAADAPVWIVFNGEIYNFRELREKLIGRGHIFRSSGDTEVFLAAFLEWGTDCFSKLEGMWAAVIVDGPQRRVVVSRDRFGIKPLYWCIFDGAILLASEIRQIIAARRERPRANHERVAAHLRGSRDPVTEATFFEGIESVPPATWFSIPADRGAGFSPAFQEYWRLRDFRSGAGMSYEVASDRFAETFEAAIDSHRVADVKVGSLVSGGLDSAAVTASLARFQKREGLDLTTFSFGFRQQFSEFSELPFADALVAAEGLELAETSFDAGWVARNLRAVVESIEEPPLALPVLAQFRIFQLCRERGVTVVLDGQGADEMLAGYPYHQRLLLVESLRHAEIGSFAAEVDAISRRSGTPRSALLSDFFLQPLWRRFVKQTSWWTEGFGVSKRRPLDQSADDSALNRRLYHDVRWGNARTILMYADRNAMRHSIEARVPFFDRALVELIFTMPAAFKAGRGERKRVLRDYARAIGVPSAITERADRMGFNTPDAGLFLGSPELKAMALEALTDRAFMAAPFVSRSGLETMTGDYRRGAYRGGVRPFFRAVSLSLWRDIFDVTF